MRRARIFPGGLACCSCSSPGRELARRRFNHPHLNACKGSRLQLPLLKRFKMRGCVDSRFAVITKRWRVAHNFASACGSANGKVERRRRDAGMQPERNDRRRTKGGSRPIIRCQTIHARDECAFCETERAWSGGNKADLQPVK